MVRVAHASGRTQKYHSQSGNVIPEEQALSLFQLSDLLLPEAGRVISNTPHTLTNPSLAPIRSLVLVNIRLPSLLHFLLLRHLLLHGPHLSLDPFPRPQYLTLQVEATSFLRIVGIE